MQYYTKSTLSKSMQPSIYPVGRRWTFSRSQVYTTQPISVMIALPQSDDYHYTTVNIISIAALMLSAV